MDMIIYGTKLGRLLIVVMYKQLIKTYQTDSHPMFRSHL